MEIIVAEKSFDPPTTEAKVQATVNEPSPCYGLRRVTHVMSVLSRDGRRCLCLYEAPDASAVRDAHEENGDSYDRIWSGPQIIETSK